MKHGSTGLGIVLAVSLTIGATSAAARVIPYAPITPRQAIPAIQKRAARHLVLQEVLPQDCLFGCTSYLSRLVIHDPQGIESPRDVTPGGKDASIVLAAASEGDDGTLRLLFLGGVDADFGFHYSADGGTTWSLVSIPGNWEANSSCTSSGVLPLTGRDIGGPVAGGTFSPIRLGTVEVPFVVVTNGSSDSTFWGVRRDGSAYLLATAGAPGALIGSDDNGESFLVAGIYVRVINLPWGFSWYSAWRVARLDLSGRMLALFDLPYIGLAPKPCMEGWITTSGNAWLNVSWPPGAQPGVCTLCSARSVALWDPGTPSGGLFVVASSNDKNDVLPVAVPTADFSGAWVVQRDAGATTLASYMSTGAVISWIDLMRPPVEALHVGSSGKRLLVQTSRHRELQDDDTIGLALWDVGRPAPSRYDTLLLQKAPEAGFAHLDADAVAEGAPFAFGSGVVWSSPFQHVTVFGLGQEAGVVRGSLKEQLLIPASGRTPGRFGSDWRTDLVLRNPGPDPVTITASLLPNPQTTGPVSAATLTLDRSSITVVKDALGSLFGIDQGSGALLLTPDGDHAIEATSRTYTASPAGTYGMSVDATEPPAAAGAGYPVTFSAGLLGTSFRTNLVATDAFGQGSQLDLVLSTSSGPGSSTLTVDVPKNGQTQLSGLSRWMGAPASDTGSLRLAPASGGAASGLIAIDEGTNDPSWFPPDVLGTSFWTGVIPAVVHADGANGAQFRTDLFLFNPDVQQSRVDLSVKAWDKDDEETVELTLSPGESRVIRDVLFTTFGRTGVASLTFDAAPVSEFAVRVTSRTYTIQPDGSTFGMQLPPLKPCQTASAGETLEILGPIGGPGFRTNLSLVGVGGLSPWTAPPALPATAHVEIIGNRGDLLDAFDVEVPPRGGVQVNDLFRTRGLGDGPKAALIRITPSSGLVSAYATTMDDGTNDPVYFPGRVSLDR
ncbi:MAG: hypothetical protein ACM3JH_15805 [Acidithiobacillales bacterium]